MRNINSLWTRGSIGMLIEFLAKPNVCTYVYKNKYITIAANNNGFIF